MHASYLKAFLAITFAPHTLARGIPVPPLATTITVDQSGESIFIPVPGKTSSVAAPAATATLVYNCQSMPLICENISAWAKANGSPSGDLPNRSIFYYDPDNGNKNRRRIQACRCFNQDNCATAGKSIGKHAGSKVFDIVSNIGGPYQAITAISKRKILGGSKTPKGRPRIPFRKMPGRFFAEGLAFTCDEFPPAVFINGGAGATTICALQDWTVYSADTIGKWNLPSGQRAEQNWQAQSHKFLRSAYGIRKTCDEDIGFDSVWPFVMSTTTLGPTIQTSKAWVVVNPVSTKVVDKQYAGSATYSVPTPQAMVVTGDEELDARHVLMDEPAEHTGIQSAEPNYADPAIAARTPYSAARPHLAARVLTPDADDFEPQNSTCTFDYELQGSEDIEVGDDDFDDF